MAGRVRTIKPEVLEDEVAAGLTDAAWRLWVSLWVLADDYGDVRAGDRYLAANVWQDTSRDAATPLAELVAKGRVAPYAVQGQRYVRIHGWAKHQRVDNAGKARVPAPEEDDGTWSRTVASDAAENRGESPRTSAPDSATHGSAAYTRAGAHARALPRPRPPTNDHDRPHAANGAASDLPGLAPTAGTEEVDAGRGKRIPDCWAPKPETLAWAKTEFGVDGAACVPEFVEYWRSLSGSKARRANWDLTFRGRVRQLVDWGRAPLLAREVKEWTAPPRTGVASDEASAEAFASMQAELADFAKSKTTNGVPTPEQLASEEKARLDEWGADHGDGE